MNNTMEMNEIISKTSITTPTTTTITTSLLEPIMSIPKSFSTQFSLKNSPLNIEDIKYIDAINSTPVLLPKKSTKKEKPSLKTKDPGKHQENSGGTAYNCHNNSNYNNINNNYEEQHEQQQQQYKINNNIKNNNFECENNVKLNENEHHTKPIFSKNNTKSIKKSPSVKISDSAFKENENGNDNNRKSCDYFLNERINRDCLDNFTDSLINISIASSIRGKNEFHIPTNPPIKVTIEKSNSNMTICQDSLAPNFNPYHEGI